MFRLISLRSKAVTCTEKRSPWISRSCGDSHLAFVGNRVAWEIASVIHSGTSYRSLLGRNTTVDRMTGLQVVAGEPLAAAAVSIRLRSPLTVYLAKDAIPAYRSAIRRMDTIGNAPFHPRLTTSSGPTQQLFRKISAPPVLPGLRRNFRVIIALAAFSVLGACSNGTPEMTSIVFTSSTLSSSDSVSRGTDIFVVRNAGETPSRMTTAGSDDLSPKWSPNKAHIAFLSQRNEGFDIWITNPDGNDKRQVFVGLGENPRFEWAPDSKRIAYEFQNGGYRQIYVGDIESGNSAPVTSPTETAFLGSWSPDGEWLVYTLVAKNRSGVYKVNPAGVNEIEVSASVGVNPQWSPNGRWIVFGADDDGYENIFAVPSGGGDETNLTPNAGDNTSVDWSPDGERIVFVSDRDGNPEIYVIDVTGHNEKRLTSNRSKDLAPSWSRKTNRIAFMSDVDGDFDLFTMRPDGSGQRRVTSDSRDIVDLDW